MIGRIWLKRKLQRKEVLMFTRTQPARALMEGGRGSVTH
jgi:hypothetical protein